MPMLISPIPHPEWTPLPFAGCHGVESKGLLHSGQLSLALLSFSPYGTIHEHPADLDIDVICLEGEGLTSVSGEQAPLRAGEQVHWPACEPHRLWTEGQPMLTLMIEYARAAA